MRDPHQWQSWDDFLAACGFTTLCGARQVEGMYEWLVGCGYIETRLLEGGAGYHYRLRADLSVDAFASLVMLCE